MPSGVDGGRVIISMHTDATKARAGIKKTEQAVKSMTSKGSKNLQKFGGAMGGFGKQIMSMMFNPVMLAIGAFTALIGIVKKSMREADNLVRSQVRLEQILRTVSNATDEQIKSVSDLSDEYEKLLGVADDTTRTMASQLASFGLTASAIEDLLLPALDTAVANYNTLDISQEQAINIANLLGKAYTGQAGALTRVGILLDDNQKELLKNGDEATRLATLVEILEQNYGGLAKAISETPEGKMARLREAFGNLFETIGLQLNPAVGSFRDRMTEALQNEKVLAFAKGFGQLLKGVMDVVGGLFDMFGALNNVTGSAGTMGEGILFILNLIVDALGFVSAVLRGDFTTAFLFLKKLFAGFLDFTGKWVERVLEVLVFIPMLMLKAFGFVFEKFGGLFANIIDGIVGVLNFALGGISKFINFAINGINLLIKALNKLPFTNIKQLGQVDFTIDVGGEDVISKIADSITTAQELLGDFPSKIGDAISGLGDLVFDEEDKESLDKLTTAIDGNEKAVWENTGGLGDNTDSVDQSMELTEEDARNREDFLKALFRDIKEGIFDRAGGINQQISRSVASGDLNLDILGGGTTPTINIKLDSRLMLDGRELGIATTSMQRTNGGFR